MNNRLIFPDDKQKRSRAQSWGEVLSNCYFPIVTMILVFLFLVEMIFPGIFWSN